MQKSTSETPRHDPVKKRRRPVLRKSAAVQDIYRIRGGVDRTLLLVTIVLVCFGSVMVFSASYATAFSKNGDSFYYVGRQVFFAALGLAVMIIVSYFDYRFIMRLQMPLLIVTVLLLVAVLALGTGGGEESTETIKRWLRIGPLVFQPSEVAKFALIVTLGAYYEKYAERIHSPLKKNSEIYGAFVPFAITIFVGGLVVLEKHLSGFGILFIIGICIIILSGAKIKKLLFLIGGTIAVAGVGAMMVGYTRERIDLWLHPENYPKYGKIWQTLQGLRAVGSGGVLGVGLGASQQKYMYVSAPHNDFIFSIICEELGFVGALAVITLFCILTWRGAVIAKKAPDTFSRLVAIGITVQITVQAILNIAVVTSLFPNTGISLPFFSYGGTSLVMLLFEVGVLLSISRYSKDPLKGADLPAKEPGNKEEHVK